MVKINNFAVVIPSYNESKNISILISGINKNLKNALIVIIDDSAMEENEKIKKIIKKFKNIELITRLKKSGRGSAVLIGFKRVLKYKKIDYIFEMDSDLAHDPKEFSRFIKEIEVYPYDLVIGSRYKSGGKIDNISPNRTIMSRLINYFLYFWLNIKISDYTSGFRLYSRNAVIFLLKTKIKAKGFIALSEIAYKLSKNNFKISEVPITWNYRIYGKSNVNFNELVTSLLHVIKMKFFK